MLFLNMLNKLSCSKTYLQMKYCAISKIGGISLQVGICRISWHLFSLPPMLAWERVRILQNLFVKQGISPLFVDENLTHGRLVILQSVSMMFEFPMKNSKIWTEAFCLSTRHSQVVENFKEWNFSKTSEEVQTVPCA